MCGGVRLLRTTDGRPYGKQGAPIGSKTNISENSGLVAPPKRSAGFFLSGAVAVRVQNKINVAPKQRNGAGTLPFLPNPYLR